MFVLSVLGLSATGLFAAGLSVIVFSAFGLFAAGFFGLFVAGFFVAGLCDPCMVALLVFVPLVFALLVIDFWGCGSGSGSGRGSCALSQTCFSQTCPYPQSLLCRQCRIHDESRQTQYQ